MIVDSQREYNGPDSGSDSNGGNGSGSSRLRGGSKYSDGSGSTPKTWGIFLTVFWSY